MTTITIEPRIQRLLDVINDIVNNYFPRKARFRDAQILTIPIGSHFLGLATPDSDLDFVCVFPQHALALRSLSITNHRDLMSSLATCLTSSPQLNISQFRAVLDATVPILKCVANIDTSILGGVVGGQSEAATSTSVISIDLDVMGALVPVESIDPTKHVFSLFRHSETRTFRLDRTSYMSLIGATDCGYMKNIIEKELYTRISPLQFRLYCENVILWAKRRCLYSSIFGYFAGFSLRVLAIYAARKLEVIGEVEASQLNESISASILTRFFFSTFDTWKWSRWAVTLDESDRNRDVVNLFRKSPMAFVLTPTRKQSVRNMTKSSFEYVVSEFRIASEALQEEESQEIQTEETREGEEEGELISRSSSSLEQKIQRVIGPKMRSLKVFCRGKKTVALCSTLKAATMTQFVDWKGWTESRLVKLVFLLEALHDRVRALIYPMAMCRGRKRQGQGEDDEQIVPPKKPKPLCCHFVAVMLLPPLNEDQDDDDDDLADLDFFGAISQFVESVMQWRERQPSMSLKIGKIRKRQLRNYVQWKKC